MNKKKYIALPIMLSLLCMNNVYADCTQEAKDEFKKIEDQYKITTTYNSESKTYTVRIQEGNPDKFSYVIAINYQYSCKKISKTINECTGLKNGTSFYATVIGMTSQCNDIMKEELIRLERYNEFYEDPLCEGIEEFVLCQEIYDKEIDRETFESRVESYKESKEETTNIDEEKKQEEKETENVLDKLKMYVENNLTQIIIITIFIILVIISLIVTINSSRKSRRLE